jgi:hypothetical protein
MSIVGMIIDALLTCSLQIPQKIGLLTFSKTLRLSPSSFLHNFRLGTSDSTSDSPIEQNFLIR